MYFFYFKVPRSLETMNPSNKANMAKVGNQFLKVSNLIIDGVFNVVENIIDMIPFVDKNIDVLHKKTGLKRRWIIASLSLIPLVIYMFPALSYVIFALYPLYMSIKAIEGDKDVRSRWMMYWLFFHVIHFAEISLELPLKQSSKYTFIKCAFLFWCMAPVELNGCCVTYALLKPLIQKSMEILEQGALTGVSRVRQLINENEMMLKKIKKDRGINSDIFYSVSQNNEYPRKSS